MNEQGRASGLGFICETIMAFRTRIKSPGMA
jgi:hypothetical protein